MNNLTGAYRTAGDLQQAIPLFKQALNDCRRVLGDDHPRTRTVYGNLRAAMEGSSSE
ncbi:tetratricopeptide repeat protein [Micromonospora sagamiensis]|uniref:tetratricopeptide repeat protein n=1 Tax=Micromonospora sagamiensis TaxID=47875 RepID=UPI0011A03345|nr:tetratricopeptide repeat protein [Micromonospora sagamiensis]BCL14974.1 hypothetical protein GCM10017556_27130 [Micromonospora sagamiensis]